MFLALVNADALPFLFLSTKLTTNNGIFSGSRTISTNVIVDKFFQEKFVVVGGTNELNSLGRISCISLTMQYTPSSQYIGISFCWEQMSITFGIAVYTVEYCVTGYGSTGRKPNCFSGIASLVQTELLAHQEGTFCV